MTTARQIGRCDVAQRQRDALRPGPAVEVPAVVSAVMIGLQRVLVKAVPMSEGLDLFRQGAGMVMLCLHLS